MRKSISIQCPSCATKLRGKSELAGKQVKCPKCAHHFLFDARAPSNDAGTTATIEMEKGLDIHLLDIKWQARPGILVTDTKTYGCGIGSEYVYCYSYPIYLEMAELKQEDRFRIKVGMATDDPIGRIYGQFASSKTAVSETPVVLLIFKTLAARHLERWFHKRLERASDAAGSEWFLTNCDELIKLFGDYLLTASRRPDQLPTSTSPSEHMMRGDGGSTIADNCETTTTTGSDIPRRPTGQHRRDASGKTAKDHILLLWVKTMLSGGMPDVEAWSQQFGVESRTIRSWMSCWKNYEGTSFTGTEGWPRITHSILHDVSAAKKIANSAV